MIRKMRFAQMTGGMIGWAALLVLLDVEVTAPDVERELMFDQFLSPELVAGTPKEPVETVGTSLTPPVVVGMFRPPVVLTVIAEPVLDVIPVGNWASVNVSVSAPPACPSVPVPMPLADVNRPAAVPPMLSTPATMRPRVSGRLKVVLPSPLPNAVPVIAKSVAYVVLEMACPNGNANELFGAVVPQYSIPAASGIR
jgi:hypothetical protein